MILPLTITGFAITCSAVLVMCLSSLTVLSSALKITDHYAQSRFLSAQLLLRSDLRIDTTAGLASVPDVPQHGIQFISFESRFPSAQLLLRGDLRYDTTASLASVPDVLQRGIQFIRFDVPTLAPMAFTQFCLKYASECKPQRLVFRGGRLKLTNRRWAELENVNRAVNSSILPQRKKEGLAVKEWLLGPVLGDCNDYAATKRHQLIARGWPARAVLLSEVVTVSGEHHLVTVVRTNGGDLVLDNLTDRIMPWIQKPYQWLRIQTPRNPNYWASISGQGPDELS